MQRPGPDRRAVPVGAAAWVSPWSRWAALVVALGFARGAAGMPMDHYDELLKHALKHSDAAITLAAVSSTAAASATCMRIMLPGKEMCWAPPGGTHTISKEGSLGSGLPKIHVVGTWTENGPSTLDVISDTWTPLPHLARNLEIPEMQGAAVVQPNGSTTIDLSPGKGPHGSASATAPDVSLFGGKLKLSGWQSDVSVREQKVEANVSGNAVVAVAVADARPAAPLVARAQDSI